MTAMRITRKVSMPWEVPFKFTTPQEMWPSNWGFERTMKTRDFLVTRTSFNLWFWLLEGPALSQEVEGVLA